jgi:TIR domain-containing protein
MTASMNTNANAGRAPRVFLSYARSDGEQFATDLRQWLAAEHIQLWQDRVGMEGGRDWWQQITEALDKVEFMVLVMTPAAMLSETVRKEWRYARQQGVCVYPVRVSLTLTSTVCHTGCAARTSTTPNMKGRSWSTIGTQVSIQVPWPPRALH